MLSHLRPALVLVAGFTLLTGLAYPLAITGLAQVLMPASANGSLVRVGDRVVGSALIGQGFAGDAYVHGRPSAAGDKGYDATSSSGSNLGPLSRKLLDRIEADAASLRTPDGAAVPVEAVTTSASGLDPHISPAHARLQVRRIAAARKVPEARVLAVVEAAVEPPLLGLVGQPRVNVLRLNLALDAMVPAGAD